jgi:hypothetical protein
LDTTNDARSTPEVPGPEETGWDSHQVWRERVREARTVRAANPRPQTIAEGWDPLQTWHDRVLRPRKS